MFGVWDLFDVAGPRRERGPLVMVTIVGLPKTVGWPQLAAGVECRDFGTYGIVAAPGGVAHLHLAADEFAVLGLIDGSRSVAALIEAGGETTADLLDDLWDTGSLEGAPQPSARPVVLTRQGRNFARGRTVR